MGWFDEQIRERKEHDRNVLEDSFLSIAGAVSGRRISQMLHDESRKSLTAIEEILKYYHVKPQEIPDNIKDQNEQLEYLLRPYGIMRRRVKLEKGWHKDASGAMLAVQKSDGAAAALIPTGMSGYSFTDENGKRVKVNGKNEKLFEAEAISFYKALPMKKIGTADLLRYGVMCLSVSDFILFGLATLAFSLVGLLSPKISHLLFSDVLGSKSIRLLLAITVFSICVSVSKLLFSSIKRLLTGRIKTKMGMSVAAAVMMRILSLPASFFKDYSAGELASRARYIEELCYTFISVILGTGLESLISLIYITQIFNYARALVVPALLIILATAVFSILPTLLQMGIAKKQMELSAKENGMSYALIAGIQKIRLSGAEKRAFARWGELYAKEAELSYNPPLFLKLSGVISMAISLAGTIILYYAAIAGNIGVADYYAFNTAYGMVSGAFLSLTGITVSMAQILPILTMAKSLMEAEPEVAVGKQVITRLSGGIELNNVSFRYRENMPLVVDNLSLKIRSGQYVAIVGATGCGKSTLLRLLLGFETPQRGAVYYDGRDLASIDLKSLRRKVGVVMQNGRLFQGDIFSNITISAPYLTLDEAWEAAELAGIADDIRAMPMGMHTVISEGSGGISGGQRQRLMIARAIAPKPKILMFDEATSALDNLTQKKVSESLDRLKCTRIVIAHRLSTIRQCDRILVLDKGKILEDGTYEELLERGGTFAALVARQRLD
ncbi:MAG: NHLP bacteriocin export ABC transporter permease/ATPase subunit [Clostridium sp.]|nr:NHLP bacteriocin export ABC transporter permease/ATPase subunit [Clostridium sp.]